MIYKPIDVYKLAVDIFGEDRVDLNLLNWYEESDKGSYNITIWFPEVEITNSRGDKHTVRDLYVKWTIGSVGLDRTYKISLHMYGARGEITAKEAYYEYGHSHLSGWWWGNFCTGSSPFTIMMEEVKQELSEESWEMLFLSLENYLKWESLEGVPYKYMSNIAYPDNGDVDLRTPLRSMAKNIPLSTFAYTNELMLAETDELEQFYNENSPVKSFNNVTNESIQHWCDIWNNSSMKNRKFDFLGKTIQQRVVPGETIEQGTTRISRDVINVYNNLIKDRLRIFNKNIRYEQLKQLRKEKVFGKAFAYQQAQSSNISAA